MHGKESPRMLGGVDHFNTIKLLLSPCLYDRAFTARENDAGYTL